MNRSLTFALLLTVACATPPAHDLRRAWGGHHIGLAITDRFSGLSFDCASGSIPSEFTVDGAGNFSLNGTYSPGVGGPKPIEPPRPLAAAYRGRVKGQHMTLTVDLEGNYPDSGYALRQGEPRQVFACALGLPLIGPLYPVGPRDLQRVLNGETLEVTPYDVLDAGQAFSIGRFGLQK